MQAILKYGLQVTYWLMCISCELEGGHLATKKKYKRTIRGYYALSKKACKLAGRGSWKSMIQIVGYGVSDFELSIKNCLGQMK